MEIQISRPHKLAETPEEFVERMEARANEYRGMPLTDEKRYVITQELTHYGNLVRPDDVEFLVYWLGNNIHIQIS